MPSPFPGMDPWLEHPGRWPDVDGMLVTTLREALGRAVRPRYVVTMDERVYVDDEPEAELMRPDVAVRGSGPGAPSGTTTSTPVVVPTVLDAEVRERFLEVRDADSREVVTAIEVLSPTNKRGPASEGRQQYLEKRRRVLRSATHLVEIDLLRGGDRVPMRRPLPPGDYHVVVSRASRRPDCEVYPVALRERLPIVAIPLRGDESAPLDLQAVVETAYDRAGYDLIVDYAAEPSPPLGAADRAWARERVQAWRATRSTT